MNLHRIDEALSLNWRRVAYAIGGLAAFALFLVGASLLNAASADGLPKKGKVAAPADEVTLTATAARWSGPWVSATLGYAVQSTDIANVTFATKDVTYGGAVGWDHQFAGSNLLVGIGADIDWTSADGVLASWDRQWSAWARGGVLLTPTLLAYGLVGHTEMSGDFVVPVFGDNRGLTLGAGLEALFKDGWFVKAEGRWIDLGGDMGVESGQYAARLGVGYRFGAGK
jgi:opacity protein-like surface antigen